MAGQTRGGSQWAWLGDMELDDTLLGLGAAGVFPSASPTALGFLVNAGHCVEKDPESGAVRATEMYREKRDFLDAFFSGAFFAVLDRYASGGKGRGWVGELTSDGLSHLGPACGLEDELEGWISQVADAEPSVLHLIISGPLLGRGSEICRALRERVLERPAPGGSPEAQIIIWTYAGSFNLTHSSPADRQSLRELMDGFPTRVAMVETTLKSGAWLCEPPRPFWGQACPTSWSLDEAKRNPVGFNMSTDIQSVNMFLEEYSSRAPETPRKGLRWIFERIAQARSEETKQPSFSAASAPAPISVSDLLQQLEIRSLATNLTKMVPPGTGSMGKVREALAASGDGAAVSQQRLEESFERAKGLLEGATAKGSKDEAARAALFEAAREYAELYRGHHGDFHEAGCVECFPSEKPYSGPRLDKRCILRCMAQAKLQGGPTADLLIVLALLLHLPSLDGGAAATAPAPVEEEAAGGSANVCCSLLWSGEAKPVGQQALCQGLPRETRALFRLGPGSEALPRALATDLTPGTTMDEASKAALAPLVDAAAMAVVSGAKRLQAAGGSTPAWGRPPSARLAAAAVAATAAAAAASK